MIIKLGYVIYLSLAWKVLETYKDTMVCVLPTQHPHPLHFPLERIFFFLEDLQRILSYLEYFHEKEFPVVQIHRSWRHQ